MKKNIYGLTVIVPFFNEEITLKKSVNRLNKVTIIKEIFLVDDCSVDESPKIGKLLEKNINKVKYYKTPINLGKGGAVVYPMKEVRTNHVVIHDADLEYNPDDIYKIFDALTSNELIILGTRFNSKNKNEVKMNLTLEYIEKISTKLFNNLFKTNLTDIGSGYKLIPTDFLQKSSFTEKGFFFEIELLAKFLKNGGSIYEVPISYHARSKNEGKKNNSLIMLRFLIKVFIIRIKSRKF
jgi:dolichol-phosphate mannosyltransferase